MKPSDEKETIAMGELTAELLAERARALSQSEDSSEGPDRAGDSYLFLKLGKETFAIPLKQAVEILARPEILPIPGTPRAVAGVANVRGAIVDVLDLANLLGMGTPGEGADRRPVVLCESGSRQFGLVVESVAGIESILPASIGPVTESMPQAIHEFVSGLARSGPSQQAIVSLLDVDRIFRAKQLDPVRGEAAPESAR